MRNQHSPFGRKSMWGRVGNIPAITGTAPVLAALINGVALSTAVTWGSYSGTGAVTTTKQMKLNAGAWVAYVGGTVVNTGELWQVRELCSDTLVTDQPFTSVQRTVTTAATAPATITSGQWTLADSPSAGGDTLTLTLTALPADGGSAITNYQYRRNGGAATSLGGGLGTGARSITVLATTLANIEVRAQNAIGDGAWSDTKSATPTVVSSFTARFGIGSEQASGTGSFDTNLYTGSPPANGTYGNFTVTSGVISCNGSQTAGSYTPGGYPVTVTSGYVAVKTQAEWNALTPASISGKTVIVREAAALSVPTSWNYAGDFNWATILGDGEDPRPTTQAELDDASDDSRKHFVKWYTIQTKKLILDRLRVVTGSVVGAKVDGIIFEQSGGGAIEDIQILRSYVVASRPDPEGNYLGGDTTFPGAQGIIFTGGVTRRISVRDCVVTGSCGNPGAIALNDADEGWCEIIGNWVDLFYYDGIRPPASSTILGGCYFTRPMSTGADAGDPHCDGVQYISSFGTIEACAFVEGPCRGIWQSIFAYGDTNQITIRNVLVSDFTLYGLSAGVSLDGSQVRDYTWLPRWDMSFPLANPQGGIRFEDVATGTNDILNSVFRATGSSIIDGAVTQTGNVNSWSWVSADWTTAYPNWSMSTLPTLQNAIQYHAAPSGGGAAAGKGANQNITSWGGERSSYVLNVTTPTVSSITITPTVDGFTGTLRTDVWNNSVFYCVIPQAQGNPTWREIKERRVPNGFGYGDVWCSRANAGTDLAISCNTATAGTAYKFVAVAENGWSKQSAITTSNFTTVSASIQFVGVGTAIETTGTTLSVPMPTASNGNYLVAFIRNEMSNRPATPSGWTLIGNGTGFGAGFCEASIYGRTKTGSEGATVDFVSSGSQPAVAFCAAYSGVDGTATEASGAEATNTSFSTTSRDTPTLTAVSGSCILHIWAIDYNTITLPNPSDLVAYISHTDTIAKMGAEHQLSVSAGTTTARTATASGNSVWNAMQVELIKA